MQFQFVYAKDITTALENRTDLESKALKPRSDLKQKMMTQEEMKMCL